MTRPLIPTRQLVLCGLFVALIAVGAYIRIPIPAIPFTLQFMMVMLAGQLLTAGGAALCLGTYMLLGLLGLPVFSGGGGIAYALKPSFGYLLGFVFAAPLVAWISHRVPHPSYWRRLSANAAGFVCVYTFGLSYYYLLNVLYFGKVVPLGSLFLYCFAVFLPSDITFCFLTAYISKRLHPVI